MSGKYVWLYSCTRKSSFRSSTIILPVTNFELIRLWSWQSSIHKWSHAQYFTTRLHLIFFSVLDLVHHKLLALRPSWKTATKVRTAAAAPWNFITFSKIKVGLRKAHLATSQKCSCFFDLTKLSTSRKVHPKIVSCLFAAALNVISDQQGRTTMTIIYSLTTIRQVHIGNGLNLENLLLASSIDWKIDLFCHPSRQALHWIISFVIVLRLPSPACIMQ